MQHFEYRTYIYNEFCFIGDVYGAVTYYRKAFLCFIGDVDGAVTYYRKAFLKDSRDQWQPMVNAAKALNQLGKMDQAEELLNR